MSRPCIFCEIAAGRADATRVYEDELCIALMDLYPLTPGHVLIIPREHAVQVTDIPRLTTSHLFAVAQRLLRAQRHAGYGVRGTNLLLNDGPAANQTVAHVHIHLIPRQSRDGLSLLSKIALHISGLMGIASSRRALAEHAEKIRYALDNDA